jgi:hypothetical protein
VVLFGAPHGHAWFFLYGVLCPPLGPSAHASRVSVPLPSLRPWWEFAATCPTGTGAYWKSTVVMSTCCGRHSTTLRNSGSPWGWGLGPCVGDIVVRLLVLAQVLAPLALVLAQALALALTWIPQGLPLRVRASAARLGPQRHHQKQGRMVIPMVPTVHHCPHCTLRLTSATQTLDPR